MAKRLTCPRCRADNVYDVPSVEAAAPMREVRCRGCGHRFSYGFAPEYVTTPDPALSDLGQGAAEVTYDAATEVAFARERLVRHVAQYADYHDRDRDILLLHLVDMAERLDNDLTSIKRVIDVVAKRGPLK